MLRTSRRNWPAHLLWKGPGRVVLRKCLQLFKEDAREAGGRRAEAFEKAERFNVEAGLLKPDETLKSYDGFFTDQFVK